MWSARQLQLQGDPAALRPPAPPLPLSLAPSWEILQVFISISKPKKTSKILENWKIQYEKSKCLVIKFSDAFSQDDIFQNVCLIYIIYLALYRRAETSRLVDGRVDLLATPRTRRADFVTCREGSFSLVVAKDPLTN